MQKIIPHLWFDKEAKEAAEFYVSVFGGQSQIPMSIRYVYHRVIQKWFRLN